MLKLVALVSVAQLVIGAAGDTTIPVGQILNVGLVGVVLIMVVSRKWLVPTWTLDATNAVNERLLAERNAERVARNDLEALVRDKYVPSLEAARVTQESMLAYLQATSGPVKK